MRTRLTALRGSVRDRGRRATTARGTGRAAQRDLGRLIATRGFDGDYVYLVATEGEITAAEGQRGVGADAGLAERGLCHHLQVMPLSPACREIAPAQPLPCRMLATHGISNFASVCPCGESVPESFSSRAKRTHRWRPRSVLPTTASTRHATRVPLGPVTVSRSGVHNRQQIIHLSEPSQHSADQRLIFARANCLSVVQLRRMWFRPPYTPRLHHPLQLQHASPAPLVLSIEAVRLTNP